MTSNAGKKGRKPLRFLSVAQFSSFRTFEYVRAKGEFSSVDVLGSSASLVSLFRNIRSDNAG